MVETYARGCRWRWTGGEASAGQASLHTATLPHYCYTVQHNRQASLHTATQWNSQPLHTSTQYNAPGRRPCTLLYNRSKLLWYIHTTRGLTLLSYYLCGTDSPYIWLDITTLLHHAEHAQDSMKPQGSLVPYIRSSRDNRRPHIGRRVSAKPYNALVCFHCSWRLFHLTANTTSRRTLHTFHFLQWVGASPVLAMAGSSNATLVAELLTWYCQSTTCYQLVVFY